MPGSSSDHTIFCLTSTKSGFILRVSKVGMNLGVREP
jgi:hypothetical protein